MAVNLSPYGGVGAQFLDNSGNVLTGGKIFTYTAGTTTPQPTYTTSAGNVPHPNPIILDAAGRVPSGGEIWLTDGLSYKFILRDANDVLIATYDNINGINSNFVAFTNQQEIQTATAGQTVFNLTTMQYQPGTNSLSVFVDGVNQYGPGAQYAYLETDSDTVTFVNGLHVGAEVKFTTSQLNSSASTNTAAQVAFTGFKGQAGTVQNLAGNDGADWIGFEQAGVGAVAISAEDKMRQIVSVKDFGAVGDGVADDTVAIQNAINATLTPLGGQLYFPSGTYLISDSLNIPFSTQWTISGASRGSTIIKQNTNNKPIFYFTQDLTWGWTIKDLSGTWTNQQPATNTAAIMFSFYFATNAANWFNFIISNVNCSNGFRCLSHAPGANGAIWGFVFENYIHGSTMTGGAVFVSPTISIGQPNMTIRNLYGRADNMVAAEYFIQIVGGDSISLDGIEVNAAALGSKLLYLGSSFARIGSIKTEAATYTTGTIINLDDSAVSIDTLVINGTTINTGTFVTAVSLGGAASQLILNNVTFTFQTAITGKFYAFGSGAFPAFKLTVGNISGLLGTANAFLTNVGGTVSPNSTVVNSWQNIGTGIVGDTDLTLTAGLNEPVQVFKTNLTASRTVTLADQSTGSDSNLFTGFQWTIASRQPSYSNSIVIKRSDGATLYTLSANGSVTLSWSRFAWTVISQGN